MFLSKHVILPLEPLLLPPFPHCFPRPPIADLLVSSRSIDDSLYPFCLELLGPEPDELPPVSRIHKALSEGRLTAMTANCISSAATITILPSTQDVSGEEFNSRRGISRKQAMMTALLPKAMTLRTAILRRMDICRFQTVEMGRTRM